MRTFKSLEAIRLPRVIEKFWKITFVVLIVFVLFLFLPWQQTVTGDGEVRAYAPQNRAYTITAPIDGVIDRFFVKDFDDVRKDALLFTMRDFSKEYQKHIQNILEALYKQEKELTLQKKRLQEQIGFTKRLYEQKLQAIRLKQQAIQANLEALKNLKTAKESELFAKKHQFLRSKRLHSEGIVSTQQLERHKAEYEAAKAAIAELEAKSYAFIQEKRVLEQKKKELELERSTKIASLQNKIASINKKMQTIRQKIEQNSITNERYNTREVRAKSDGYILKILQNDTNKPLKRFEPILEFAPRVEKRAIWVRVPKLHMPLVEEGLKARIVFYGWPTLYIPGWPIIEHGTYGGVVEKIEYSAQGDYFYVVIVPDPDDAPWPSKTLLRPGTQASVWINLKVVPLWYEIWRVMAAQPPVMVRDE